MKKMILWMLAATLFPMCVHAQVASRGVGNYSDAVVVYALQQMSDPSAGKSVLIQQQTEKNAGQIFLENARKFALLPKSEGQLRAELRTEMEQYLENDGDVNVVDSANNTALHWAALHGDVELAKMLFDYGIDPKIANRAGNTPARIAKRLRRSSFAALLEQYEQKWEAGSADK